MNYQQTLDFLYTRLAAFHRVGAAAYKPGLDTTVRLSEAFGNPHRRFRTIHVGGTNGKGSVSHTLAAILARAGYRVGLYTSPHLVDFPERIRVNGQPITRDAVVDFVERFRTLDIDADPSFFELATVMAFDWFARQNVDVAVIEVGLGGRLDSTNIITPDLCVITNISLDHMAILGDTRPLIAAEKAGIMKVGVPVVIGEDDDEVRPVFNQVGQDVGAPVIYATQSGQMLDWRLRDDSEGDSRPFVVTRDYGRFTGDLSGDCQQRNAATILTAVDALRDKGYRITADAVAEGFANVTADTGLMGRWMRVGDKPLTVCDTGHNCGAWQYLGPRLAKIAAGRTLHMVIGFVSDKDLDAIFPYMPRNARWYFVQPSTPRAARASAVSAKAAAYGLSGECYDSVKAGYDAARDSAADSDTIFVGGSTFVVADLLTSQPSD